MAFSGQKRIIFALIFAIVLVAGAFWIFSKSSTKTPATETEALTVLSKKVLEEAPDTDVDDLKDWEELLWGTDPSNPDTDGDGTPDGEEVKLGRNPLVAGPDDDLTKAAPQTTSVVSAENKNQTLTGQIAREAFQDFVELVNLGSDEDEAQQKIASYLTNNLQNKIGASGILTDDFSEKDIKISENNSKEAIKSYINSVARITTEEARGTQGNELILLTKLIEEANAFERREKFEEFDAYVKGYKNSAEKVIDLAAPKNYSEHHLSLANTLNNLSKVNFSFSNFMLDPISGILAINQYNKVAGLLINIFTEIKTRLDSDGIKIEPKDGAYVIFKYLY